MEGLWRVPPKRGQSSPKILNKELFPQPLGPVIIRCMPGSIEKDISFTRVSPLGERMGTLLKMIFSLRVIFPWFYRELSMSEVSCLCAPFPLFGELGSAPSTKFSSKELLLTMILLYLFCDKSSKTSFNS